MDYMVALLWQTRYHYFNFLILINDSHYQYLPLIISIGDS